MAGIISDEGIAIQELRKAIIAAEIMRPILSTLFEDNKFSDQKGYQYEEYIKQALEFKDKILKQIK